MKKEEITNKEKILGQLHPLERKTIPFLNETKDFDKLVEKSGLSDIEVMRAIQWLENKALVTIKTSEKELIFLDKNGIKYKTKGLPEKKFLKAIEKKELTLNDISKNAGLEKEEINVCIGLLRRTTAIDVNKENGQIVAKITKQGQTILSKESLEEKFLKKEFPINKENIQPEDKFVIDNFLRRKNVIKIDKKKIRTITLTNIGKAIAGEKIDLNFEDTVTTKMLKDGSWKNKKFRAYDVKINVPRIYAGRKHFVREAMDHIKKIWLEMGFVEMTGTMIQTSFWNFDALFTAQDHPVRDMQDTFFIKDPKNGKLPDKKLVDKVKKAHETGDGMNSTGWGYKWDENDSKKNVLRTHTTCLSVKEVSKLKKLQLPAKFFAVGKNFRNETVDWSHLFELAQVEGIVVDKNANFRNLIGYLQEFYKKMGFEKIRIRPAYFPYTEPSVEIDVFHPVHKKWVELGGAGIFRPEVVIPMFGEFIPVLAWGQGLERGISEYFKINDIRELYKNDLKQLREMKAWIR